MNHKDSIMIVDMKLLEPLTQVEGKEQGNETAVSTPSKTKKDRKTKKGNNIPVGDPISAAYEQVLEEVGRPLSCVINLDDDFIRNGLYKNMVVKDIKTTVSYMMDERAISYKTLTHALVADDDKYGLSCSADGTCELYELKRDRKARTRLVATTRPAKRIMDPMFAFISGTDLYVVFNIPTQSAIDSGVKGRKPIISEEGSVLASGTPFIVHFDTESGDVSFVSPRMAPMARYVCSLVDEPNRPLPMLLVANVLTSRSKAKEESPSMKHLLKMFLEDEEPSKQNKKKFPVGISMLRIEDNAKFVSIPMSGSKEYRIASVIITPSEDGENNIIRLHSIFTETQENDIDDIDEMVAIANMEKTINEVPESSESENRNETLQ